MLSLSSRGQCDYTTGQTFSIFFFRKRGVLAFLSGPGIASGFASDFDSEPKSTTDRYTEETLDAILPCPKPGIHQPINLAQFILSSGTVVHGSTKGEGQPWI